MSDDPSILSQLGIKLADLAGGAAGGTAGGIVFRRVGIFSFLGSVATGALTAAYLTNWAVHYAGDFSGGASFVVGLSAMSLCQLVVKGISKLVPGGSNGNRQSPRED